MEKNSKKLISVDCGHLGEDIVITELTRNNYIASRLDDRAKLFDIIAMNKNGTRFCAIQVKTNQIGSNRFTLSQKMKIIAKNKHIVSMLLSNLKVIKIVKMKSFLFLSKKWQRALQRNIKNI